MGNQGYGPSPSRRNQPTAATRAMVKAAMAQAMKRLPGLTQSLNPKLPPLPKPPGIEPIKAPKPAKPFEPKPIQFTEGTSTGTTVGTLAKKPGGM